MRIPSEDAAVFSMMYGKLFSSLFSKSLYGRGAVKQLVMCYVICNQKPDREIGWQVELNPKLLADTFGDVSETKVREAIGFLCGPDDDSTNEEERGAKLIKLGGLS